MTTVIVGMLVALLLAVGVVALVAIPAHKEGRDLLSPEGEQLVQNARERVVDLADRLPNRDSSGTNSGVANSGAPTGSAPSQPADVDLRTTQHDAGHRAE